MQNKLIIVYFIVLLAIMTTSCEGFKVLTLHNTSNSDITVITKPSIDFFNKTKIADYPQNQILDSSIFVLNPDSSSVLLSVFTPMIFSTKIKERDLRINYLKIETKSDTIIAENKEEILRLLKNKKTKYRRKEDKNKGIVNGKNLGNIFIRE